MRERTLYLIIGLLLGVIIMQWRQGPQPAQAQTPEPIAGAFGSYWNFQMRYAVMLSNGDIYENNWNYNLGYFDSPPTYRGNFWYSEPVPADNSSWGAIKEQFENEQR